MSNAIRQGGGYGRRRFRLPVLLSALLVLGFSLTGSLPGARVWAAAEQVQEDSQNGDDEFLSAVDRNSYYYYIQEFADAVRPDREIQVQLEQFTLSQAGIAHLEELDGQTGLLFGDTAGSASWTVQVPETGLYNLELSYSALPDSAEQISIGILVDGELPYTEANACVLHRRYSNEGIRTDQQGNGLRPLTQQSSQWERIFLSDQTGVVGELSFYLEKGEHTLSIASSGVRFAVRELQLGQKPYLPSYQEYRGIHGNGGAEEEGELSGILEIFQAEEYLYQSDTTLFPSYDRSDPLVEPYDYDAVPLNVGGGVNWAQPGQWISWEIEAPADGFYQLAVKYKQDYLQGLFSSRRIRIDGEVPFVELDAVPFTYGDQWEMKVLGDVAPYEIYLTEGKHVLTMENVVGELGDTIGVLQSCVQDLNDLYLSIMMITGSDPDPFRDYYLDRRIPGIAQRFQENAQLLFDEAERLIAITGKRGSESVLLEDTAYQLVSYAEDIESLTASSRLEKFKSNITSLSTKMSSLQEQALDIDYFVLFTQDMELPAASTGFWGGLKHSVLSFLASFKNREVQLEEDVPSVRAWVLTGRDQLQVVNDMVTDQFTPETGIQVELELASSASILQAVASGEGPDVALNIEGTLPVNYAQRGALLELSQLEGFQELKSQYFDGAFNAYMLDGKTYAIPAEQSFYMMFVRTDIFQKLGITVPRTWDELRDVAPVIQRNNLEIGMGDIYTTLLYQMGGQLYNEEQTEILFADQLSVEAFQTFTEFYTDYSFPLTYDFENRFNSGEMPLGIASYTAYNKLTYFFPGIKGMWEMYPLPGTMKEDGTISNLQATGGEQVSLVQAPASATASVIFSKAKDCDAAWSFLRWWGEGTTQGRYGTDLESVMGPAARYATANLEAFRQIPWNASEREKLSGQMAQLRVLPILPGNYYVTRGITNSFRGVMYDGENVRELLVKWEDIINDELDRKWQEYYRNNT